MDMRKKRYIFSLISYFLIIFAAIAGNGEEAVSTFLRQKGINPATVAVKVVDLKDGKVIASHNTGASLVPASIMKSVTAAALLGKAGPDYRYHTRIYIDGPVNLGYLRGNIIVEGVCDPTINSEKNPYSPDLVDEIVETLKKHHINRIEGGVIIDEDNFKGVSQPASWAKEDCSRAYGCGSHAFNYSDNSKGDVAVKNPSATFIAELRKKLKANNITMEENPMTEGLRTQIFDHVSAPLDEIMRSCMMRSDNMFAESMLRTYGKLEGGDGSTNHAAERATKLWNSKKMPMTGVNIVDGSGLSRSNKVTADFMAAVLKSMSRDSYYASFFPLAGQEGTLKKFLAGSPLDSYIAMKTGSMRGIQCYAGYKLNEDYEPTHVVVIIMNDIPVDRDPVRKAAENMLLSIFSEN